MKQTIMAIAAASFTTVAMASTYHLITPLDPISHQPAKLELRLDPYIFPRLIAGEYYESPDMSQWVKAYGRSLNHADLSFTVSNLPEGFSLAGNKIVGTPTHSGTVDFTLTASALDAEISQTYSVTSVVTLKDNSGVRTWSDGSIASSCNDYIRSPEGHLYEGPTGNGVYRVALRGTPTDVYCNMTISGGGWMLVRRTAGPTWGPWDDNATGATAYGTYVPSPTYNQTFSMRYNDLPKTKMLFASGTYETWLVTGTSWAATGSLECYNVNNTIDESSISSTPYAVNWCIRYGTNPEDPWISVRGHYDPNHLMLYGEANRVGHDAVLKSQQGTNIYIR